MNFVCRIVTLGSLGIVALVCAILIMPAWVLSIMVTDRNYPSASPGFRLGTLALSAAMLLTPPLTGSGAVIAMVWFKSRSRACCYFAPMALAGWTALAIYLGPQGMKETEGALVEFFSIR
jgi:hypothetical protein